MKVLLFLILSQFSFGGDYFSEFGRKIQKENEDNYIIKLKSEIERVCLKDYGSEACQKQKDRLFDYIDYKQQLELLKIYERLN